MVGQWKRRVGTVVAAAAAGVMVATGTAHAADAGVYVLDNSGWAGWVENGDTLTVCDLNGDGWGVRGYIYRPYAGDPANGTVLIKGNDSSSAGGCASYSTNISETIAINIKVCNYKGDSVILCDWTYAR